MRFYKKYYEKDDLRKFVSGHSTKLTSQGMPEAEARDLIALWNRLDSTDAYHLDESSVVEEPASSESSVLLTSGVLYYGDDNTPEIRAILTSGRQSVRDIENGPRCPKCSYTSTQTACYKLVTHYCDQCKGWFIAEGNQTTIQPEKPPSQAEREILLNMKLTVKRTDLIASLSASRDKIQNDHNAAVQVFNEQRTGVQALVDSQKERLAKIGFSESGLSDVVNKIAAHLSLPTTAPVLPTFITQLNTWIGKLNLASDETLELEDSSPYLQYIG